MTSSRVKRHIERDNASEKVAGDIDAHGEVCGFCGSDGGDDGLAGEIGLDSPTGAVCKDCAIDALAR